jgi:hypothetical protein
MSSLRAALVHFYDVPWNLYRSPGTPPTLQPETVARSMRETLLKQLIDDSDDAPRPYNELSECTVDPISVQIGKNIFSGVAVSAEFDRGPPFRFIHYNNAAKEVSLLLVRGSLGSQSLTDSFFERVGISGYQILNLHSSFLSSQQEWYLESLPAYRPTREEHLDSFISHVIGKLDITVTAEAPVAPNLKSLQISVPATTVWKWLSTTTGRGAFLIQLGDYVESTTGMKLGLAFSQGRRTMSQAQGLLC